MKGKYWRENELRREMERVGKVDFIKVEGEIGKWGRRRERERWGEVEKSMWGGWGLPYKVL